MSQYNALKEPSDSFLKDNALKITQTCREDNALKVPSETFLKGSTLKRTHM